MARILIVAEHDDGKLNPSTSRCVACASQFDGLECDVAVFSDNPASVAAQAATLSGVSKVIAVEDPDNAQALAPTLAPQVVALAGDYSHLLGPSTTFGKDLMPRIAALLGVAQLSDVMAVLGSHRFQRPIYAGNAIVTVETPVDDTVVATVRTASYPAVGQDGSGQIESKTIDATLPGHTRFIRHEGAGGGERPDLQAANKVVSGGRGFGSGNNFEMLFQLADALGAAVGASRAAVDAGYVANDLQVGQTGKIIAPDLYVAIGISGAIQHLTGIKDAGTIVAINKDADAPIFEVADLGLVGDLFKIVPELQTLLAEG